MAPRKRKESAAKKEQKTEAKKTVVEEKKAPAAAAETKAPAKAPEVRPEPAKEAAKPEPAKEAVKAEAAAVKAETKKEAEEKPAAKAEEKAAPKATAVVKEAAPEAKEEPKAAAAPAAVAAAPAAEKKPEPAVKKEPEEKKEPAAKAPAAKVEEKAKEEAPKAAPAAAAAPVAAPAPAAETKAEPAAKAEKKEPEKKPAATAKKKPSARAKKPAAEKKAAAAPAPEEKPAAKAEEKAEEKAPKAAAPAAAAAPAPAEEKAVAEEKPAAEAKPAAQKAPELPQPRRSVAFIGSECYPFVKTGGLGDVMYALPKALIAQNCDVHVILPKYKCIKQEWQDKMVYRGSFDMDLCSDGHRYYVGIMEFIWDGVVYDFIDNEEFFSNGNPYTNLVDDIPKFCYFSKAALAALNYMNWIPDIIHCHDWQASLVPVYLREMFKETPLARSKVILTIHNLRFQGVYNIPTIKYWTNLPDYVFNKDALAEKWTEANMMKGGLTYCNMITTVSHTYAQEIQTPEYGEGLDAHLRYHSGKLRGIVNGIDCNIWNPSTDKLLASNYDVTDVLQKKKDNKLKLQEELGLEQDENKFVVGLISRLTDQKGLDLVNAIIPQMIDGNTQFIVLGTGDPKYEDSFRYYENTYKGSVCSNIMYDEARSHKIYAGCDALLVPSRFEPCGLTQLIAMHYGTIPIVRETGGLKDTVLPYNMYTNEGNGFTFDRYESGLLLDAVNRAKTLYFTERKYWDDMVKRDMDKDVSWDVSARQYRQLYLELT